MVVEKIDKDSRSEKQQQAQRKKLSEYGKQLQEKQKVKEIYGLRERQFKRFFSVASKQREGGPGENLLSMLEQRLDNVVYRLKMAKTRTQARQIIVHGHILVNNKKVYSPALLVAVGDVISLNPRVHDKKVFFENVIEKRMKVGIKVPGWLEFDKRGIGRVLRLPVRSDIQQIPIEEHLIVELYSK